VLRSTWTSALAQAALHNDVSTSEPTTEINGRFLRTVVVPALGSGTNRTPMDAAARIGLQAIRDFPDPLHVIVVLKGYESWMAWTSEAYFMVGAGAKAT